jgi:hypothetical protein
MFLVLFFIKENKRIYHNEDIIPFRTIGFDVTKERGKYLFIKTSLTDISDNKSMCTKKKNEHLYFSLKTKFMYVHKPIHHLGIRLECFGKHILRHPTCRKQA